MDNVTLRFEFDRETKNTVRYQEMDDLEENLPKRVGTLYVRKWVVAKSIPQYIEVTIKEA